MFMDLLTGSTAAALLCIHEQLARTGAPASGSGPWPLWQAVFEPHPIHFFRDPHVIGRRKGVAVVECRKCNTSHGRLLSPGKQPRAADFAEDPVDYLR